MTRIPPTTPITEGQVVKGGHNPPNVSVERPPAPQGSGGSGTQPNATQGNANQGTGQNSARP